jgi:hypothetical protein
MRRRRLQELVFGNLVLFPAVLRASSSANLGFQDVVVFGDSLLEHQQLLHRDPTGLNVINHAPSFSMRRLKEQSRA